MTLATKQNLADRVGLHCSRCGRLTAGPGEDPKRTSNIGVAVHLAEAAAGGSRPNTSPVAGKRDPAENGVWLCQNCARLIHSDPTLFRPEQLRAWKAAAEARARVEMEGHGPPPANPPRQAPRPQADYVGRERPLRRLERSLAPGGRAAITGPAGLAGLGKTELAKTLAARLAGRFRDGVLWADCAYEEMPAIAGRWAAAYGVVLPLGDSAARAADWRRLVSQKEALLVFDNLQPGQEVEGYLPPRGRSSVLITARDANHPALHGIPRLALEVFSRGEAMKLAERVLGKREVRRQPGEAARLFALAGYLPLSVAVALQTARECGWSLEELNRRLVAAGAAGGLRDEKNLNKRLWVALETAWKALPGELQDLFRSLEVLDAGPSFSLEACVDVLGLNGSDAVLKTAARLRRLAARSLLAEVGEGRWAIHPLVAELAAKRAPGAGREAAWGRMARHYLNVAWAANDLYLEGGEHAAEGLALFDLEWQHIRAGQAWAAAHAEMDDEAARLCCAYPDIGAYCLALRVPARDRIAWLEAAEEAAQRLGDRHGEGAALGSLALAYGELGETRRAIAYHEQALAIAREMGDVAAEAGHLSALGLAHDALGETGQALEEFEQALAIRRDRGDLRGEAVDLRNLGTACAHLRQTREAIGFFEQSLAIYREPGAGTLTDAERTASLGGEGAALGSLGMAYAELGEPQRAIEHLEQAVPLFRELCAASRSDAERRLAWRGEGNALANLGLAYHKLGEPARAYELFRQALIILEEIEDPNAAALRAWVETVEE